MDQYGFIYEALDLKILILFILRRLPGEIDTDRLLALCQTDSAVSYFDFTVCLEELQESGQVTMEDGYCRITERGRHNAETVESSLPFSVRQRAEKATEDEAYRISRGRNIHTGHSIVNGAVQLELSLGDGIGEILNIKLLCADEEQAKTIEKRFRRKAEDSYQKIISILSE